MKKYCILRVCLAFLLLTAAAGAAAQDAIQKNGFDLSRALIPPADIFHGGPPRDGIPAINNPVFVPAAEVDFLRDDDIVIGVRVGDTARAYPTRILVWHEIVNDRIGEDYFAVTYCPLCGTAMVFDRRAGGTVRQFGVSGLLYQSDVLMYDRETESLWSQLAMQAVSGEAAGTALTWLSSDYLTWASWRQQYPDSVVLSSDTGYSRNYAGEPYAAYFADDALMFPVPQTRSELMNKAWVIGILINGAAKAYPVDLFTDNAALTDEVGGETITVRYHAANRQPSVTRIDGSTVPAVLVFWFAWQAFYPATGLWRG